VVPSTHGRLKNGLRYRVRQATQERLTVVCVDDDEEPHGEPFELEAAEVVCSLRLTHALCYYSTQARTIRGQLRLAQTRHRHFTLRHLIVGLGRAPEGCCVEVE